MTWVLTRSGKKFDVLAAVPHFDIVDILYGLSRECRFSGWTSDFYSVAQHSCNVARLVPAEFILEALLHDGTEAYLRDIAAPIKAIFPDYLTIERALDKKLRSFFGLPASMSKQVADADKIVLQKERSLFMPPHPDWPGQKNIRLCETYMSLSPGQVRKVYAEMFYKAAVAKTVNS